MSERPQTNWSWYLAGLFLVGLLGINLFPPGAGNVFWKDPFLIALGLAMLILLLFRGAR
jgi:hypothetical protein